MVLAAVDVDKDEMAHLPTYRSNEEVRVSGRPKLITQVLLALACAMVHMSIGTILSFSGVTLPQLIDIGADDGDDPVMGTCVSDQDLNNTSMDPGGAIICPPEGNITRPLMNVTASKSLLTESEAAFFSSASMLGAAGGSAISGPLMVVLGPRTTLLIGIPLTFTTWLILTTTPYISIVLVSRLLQGISMGVMSLAASLYVVEVSFRDYRGPLSSSLDMARNFGVLMMFSVGATKIWWRYQAIIVGLLTTIPNFILIIFLKNSPRWLAAKGRYEESFDALTFYRGTSYNIEEEFNHIEETAKKEATKSSSLLGQLRFIMKPRVGKLVASCIGYALATQLTGSFAIIAYAVPIMKDAVPSINPYVGTLLLGLFRTIGGVILMSTSSRLGRRSTYFVASTTCAVALTLVGVHMYFESLEMAPEWSWWVPFVGILLFTGSVAVAIPVAGLHVGEMLPLNCRALAYGLCDIMFYGSAFMVSYTFPYLRNALNPYGIFWFYGACSAIFAWLPVLCMPETLGKHLEEIQVSLLGETEPEPTGYGAIPEDEHKVTTRTRKKSIVHLNTQ